VYVGEELAKRPMPRVIDRDGEIAVDPLVMKIVVYAHYIDVLRLAA